MRLVDNVSRLRGKKINPCHGTVALVRTAPLLMIRVSHCHVDVTFISDFSTEVYMQISNGAKLAVASVARATPLFLPRPEIMYINVLHYSAPSRTYLLRATMPRLAPLIIHIEKWRPLEVSGGIHCKVFLLYYFVCMHLYEIFYK